MSKLKMPAGFVDVTSQTRGRMIALIGDNVGRAFPAMAKASADATQSKARQRTTTSSSPGNGATRRREVDEKP
jgi:hypothetical protein